MIKKLKKNSQHFLEMRNEILEILKEAKEEGLKMKGNQIVGYYFYGTDEQANRYIEQIKDVCTKHKENFQEMEINFMELVKEAELEVLPF